MTPESFKTALLDAKQSLTDTMTDREMHLAAAADAADRIVQLRRTIVSLSVLCNEPTELEAIGITDSIRSVMGSAQAGLTVREVREALATQGFDLTTQKNADAAITVVLNRLAEAGEIRKGEVTRAGKTVAGYAGPKVR